MQTISKPTRIQHESSSLLDNIFLNDITSFQKSGIILSDFSDHFPVFVSFNFQLKYAEKKSQYTYFDFRRLQDFNNLLENKLQDFDNNTDANTACDALTEAYADGIQQCSKSSKNSRRKTPMKPWISPGILCCINRKNKLYKNFIKNSSIQNETKYKQYKNILTNMIRDAKKRYFERSFEEHKSDGKKTWKLIGEVLNKKSSTLKFPEKFTDEQQHVYSGDEIPSGFNNFSHPLFKN